MSQKERHITSHSQNFLLYKRCPIQLLQIGPIIVQQFYRTFLCKTPRDYAEVFAPRMYNFGWGYPVPVFMFVVILVYSTISPLILVFGVIYFAMSYLVCKYQLLYGKSFPFITFTQNQLLTTAL